MRAESFIMCLLHALQVYDDQAYCCLDVEAKFSKPSIKCCIENLISVRLSELLLTK